MSTAALPQADPGEYVRASVVKVVVDGRATRSTSPGPRFRTIGIRGRGRTGSTSGSTGTAGVSFPRRGPSAFPLEEAERLEQLRVLQAGYRIRVVDVAHDSVGVDTPRT